MDVITAIALWCLSPVNSSGFGAMEKRNLMQVQECRIRLIKCVGEAKKADDQRVCFEKEVLK